MNALKEDAKVSHRRRTTTLIHAGLSGKYPSYNYLSTRVTTKKNRPLKQDDQRNDYDKLN
jgi:hypothetical protein